MALVDLLKHLKSPGVVNPAKFDQITLSIVDKIINEQWDLLRCKYVSQKNVHVGVIIFNIKVPLVIIDDLSITSLYCIPTNGRGIHNSNNTSADYILKSLYHNMHERFDVYPLLYKISVDRKGVIKGVNECLPPDISRYNVDPRSIPERWIPEPADPIEGAY